MTEPLSKSERLVYYNLVSHPTMTDTELSNRLGLAQSTVTTIRHRLEERELYRTLWMPVLSKIGCEMMVLIHTNFNPVVPLMDRVEKTRNVIESFEDIVFSMGEAQKGFSLTFSKDYTSVGMISDKRTELFASLDLLEREHPRKIVFPFEISRVYRFFNFAPFMEKQFGLGKGWGGSDMDFPREKTNLSNTEKKVLLAMVEKPMEKDAALGEHLGLSRHTIAMHKKRLQENGYVRRLRLPDLKSIGIELLVLNHVKFNPSRRQPRDSGADLLPLLSPSTVFMVSRRFEMVRLCAYSSYENYKQDKGHLLTHLHRQNILSETPLSRVFVIDSTVTIKDLETGPLVRKLLFS